MDGKTVTIKELEEIKQMDNEILVKEFEDFIRNKDFNRKGADLYYLKVVWMRKEIIKRMEK